MGSDSDLSKLLEAVLSDLKLIHGECRKKHPAIKEAVEFGIVKLRMLSSGINEETKRALSDSSEVFTPLLLGCESRFMKIVPTCLTALQRLAGAAAVSQLYATKIIDQLVLLSENDVEDLRNLQTVIVLLTTSTAVQKESLAKTIVLCFKLYFSQDSTTSNTASAAIRQVIAVVVDRMIEEDKLDRSKDDETLNFHAKCPRTLRPFAQDAYLLFQDLCQLTNGDNPYWLQGMTTMTRTFGLELMESILRHYPKAFLDHPEFSFLLKERVCPLVIKLFSPNIKYRQGAPPQPTVIEKPLFSVSVRLLRIVSVLIKQFYTLLVTECEIFLSLLVKFLDGDKPFWQRALALEVLQMLCSQPQILKSFCEYYDMQEHATKIFHDICEALGSFVQSMFAKEAAQTISSSSTAQLVSSQAQLNGAPPSSPTIDKMPNQSGFLYKGAWIPVPTLASPTKTLYLEQLDFKSEVTNVSESYGMHVVFSCLLEICNAIDVLIHERASKRSRSQATAHAQEISHRDQTGIGSEAMKHSQPLDVADSEDLSAVWLKMIDASWDSMLATLTILLEASTDETATDQVLKGLTTYASVCGQLHLKSHRDAFISCICRASLPANYFSASLNAILSKQSQAYETPASGSSQASPNSGSSSIVMATKNVQCMRALLNLAHCFGGVLSTAWHMVLMTLQHLTQILGLKLSSGGSFKAIQANELPNLVITQTMMADLPILSSMLSKLFESTQYLDDVSLHHLVDALCRLSTEDMENTANNKEPSLFPVAKMLETGLVNLNRLRVLWKPLTAHMLEVSQHPNSRLREWGADALTSLIKSANTYQHQVPLNEDLNTQLIILYPLHELSAISFADVRQQQYECVLQVLQDCAPQFGKAWPLMLRIIGSATNQQNENIIRQAFQSLQLVVTDFLPIMPCWCLQVLIEVAGKFGLQPNEINISLTAVGLLWNLSDFLYQNRSALKQELEKYVADQPLLTKEEPDNSVSLHSSLELYPLPDTSVPPFDAVWMCLFGKLGELCVDPRPAVRKSAGQTLFSTISAHGGLLQTPTWYNVLWKVLFPLLEKVKATSLVAADCPPPSDNTALPGNILIHHSRDTAEKQWAETCVLTLAGVARVFSTRSQILKTLEDYPRAWALLLEIIEASALSQNSEVALNSLKSFQEVIQELDPRDSKEQSEDKKSKQRDNVSRFSVKFSTNSEADLDLWTNAWRVWQNIGIKTMAPEHFIRNVKDSNGKVESHTAYPSQPFLAALVNVFPPLFGRIYVRFGIGDLQRLCRVLQRSVAMPLHADTSPYLLPAFHESVLSPLQQSILFTVGLLRKEVPQLNNKSVLDHSVQQPMYPILFEMLLTFVEYACCPPKVESHDEKSNYTHIRGRAGEWVVMNYVPLAEQSMILLRDLYEYSHSLESVIDGNVLLKILKTLHLPLKLKYACPSQTTWKLAIDLLMNVLHHGLIVHIGMNDPEGRFKPMWMQMATTIEDFLFSTSPPPDSQTLEQHKLDEQLDMRVLKMIREEVLPSSRSLPRDFVDGIMKLLNRGSIHSASSAMFDNDAAPFPLKEDFAKMCFETLLQFSFITNADDSYEGSGALTKLALSSLLDRCKNVLIKYAEDEHLNGQFPLPRARMFEMSFAIKAISSLLSSLKKTVDARPGAVDDYMWNDVISLYPPLLDCITCSELQVRHAVREALIEFQDLLSVPKKAALFP